MEHFVSQKKHGTFSDALGNQVATPRPNARTEAFKLGNSKMYLIAKNTQTHGDCTISLQASKGKRDGGRDLSSKAHAM